MKRDTQRNDSFSHTSCEQRTAEMMKFSKNRRTAQRIGVVRTSFGSCVAMRT